MGTHFANGVAAEQLGAVPWVKSSTSGPSGTCVEVAPLPDGQCAVRNSRDRNGPALVFTNAELRAFVEGARQGDFDHLLS